MLLTKWLVLGLVVWSLWCTGLGVASSVAENDAAAADDPLVRANALVHTVQDLLRQDKPHEALAPAKEAAWILEQALGPQHPDLAAWLSVVGNMHLNLGETDQARPFFERTLTIRQAVFGPDHTETGKSLCDLAWLHDSAGRFAMAKPLYEQCLALREKHLGPAAAAVAETVNNLAVLAQTMGDLATARGYAARALAVNETTLGAQAPETANSCNTLASILGEAGETAQARQLYQRALGIYENKLGPDDPQLSATLNNIAELDQEQGNFESAAALLDRSLRIREKKFGPDHPETALALNNLAALNNAIGRLDKAKLLYERALAIDQKRLGPEHPQVATVLVNLAPLEKTLGNYDRARAQLTQALAIQEKTFGANHPELAPILNNLALVDYAQARYESAETLLTRGLAIVTTAYGPSHARVADLQNSLGGVVHARGDLARARSLFEQALALRQELFGNAHVQTAISLHNLAAVLEEQGEADSARQDFQRALTIMRDSLGPEHPSIGKARNNLGRLETRAGNLHVAFEELYQAQQVDAANLEQIMPIASQQEKLAYLATFTDSLDTFFTLLATRLAGDPHARQLGLTVWLGRKGAVLEAERLAQQALLTTDDPATRELMLELTRVRGALARLALTGPGHTGSEAYRTRMVELGRQKEALEQRLSRASAALSRERRRNAATTEQAAKALPADSALVELARYRPYDFGAPGTKGSFLPDRYLAFVLRPGGEAVPALVDLGPAEAVNKAVAAFKNGIASGQYTATNRQAARELYDVVFAPLVKHFGKAKEIFLSPDGELNLIPFEVLRTPQDQPLIEEYTFNYLGAGRDLIGMGEIRAATGPAVVVGDPDFNFTPAQRQPQNNGGSPSPKETPDFKRSADLRGIRFSPLPGTRVEAKAVAELLGPDTRLVLGNAAVEESLHMEPPPRILHLATHGFFLTDQQLRSLMDRHEREPATALLSPLQPLAIPYERYENPLCRSGVALAGANRTLSGEGTEGIVTAEKFLGLPLSGTEIVTLSACQTGLGDIKSGEGVFGLRRAITLAGAKGMVMSMWSVPDLETQELMQTFYENIAQGMAKAHALRLAVLKQRDTTRTRYGVDNPFFWGAFIYLGDT